MRFMVMIRADRHSEAGEMPSEQLLAEMGRFNEELVKAGDSEVEIRQVCEADDFGAEFTPELRAQEERLRAEIASRSAT